MYIYIDTIYLHTIYIYTLYIYTIYIHYIYMYTTLQCTHVHIHLHLYIYIYTYINHMEHLYVSVKVSVYDIPMKSSWPLARSIVRPSGDLPFTLAGKSIYFLVIDRFARSGKQSH